MLVGLSAWSLLLAGLVLAVRLGWLDGSRTGDVLALPAAALLVVGLLFDREASEDARPDTAVFIPFTVAGLRAGGLLNVAAALTVAVLVLAFPTTG